MIQRGRKTAVTVLLIFSMTTLATSYVQLWDKPIEFTSEEEQPIDSVVGDLPARANLASLYGSAVLSQMVFQFAEMGDADISAYVRIDPSGILRIRRRLDRDVLCPGRVLCHLTGDVAIVRPADLFQIIPVRLVVIDINDNAPAFPSLEATVGLMESAGRIGDVASSNAATVPYVRLPLATDPDSPAFGVVSYQLLSGWQEFDLHFQQSAQSDEPPTDVRLMPKVRLDRETVSLYELTIIAQDGGVPAKSAVLTLTVVVEDVNDNVPVFEQGAYNVSVGEDIAINVTFLTLSASDADGSTNGLVRYQWDDSDQSNRQGLFGIDPSTGGVFIQRSIDYETASSYRLVANAIDGGSPARTSTVIVHVTVRDVNDSPPRITVNTFRPDKTALVVENAAAGEFVAYVSVTDVDGGPGGVAHCTLGDQHADKFALTPTKNGQYRIVTERALDREQVAEYSLTVRCADLGLPPLTSFSNIVVVIGDVNDNQPYFASGHYRKAVSLPENSEVGSYVGLFNASDADAGVNSNLVYSIIEEEARQYLTIDAATGEVRTRVPVDFEQVQSIEFTVKASDSGQPRLTANQSVLLRVVDKNDEAPHFHLSNHVFHVLEDAPVGTVVGELHATDRDAPPNNVVAYFVETSSPFMSLSSSALPLAVGEGDGKIYTTRPLDRETLAAYRFNIIAKDKANPTLSDVTQVHVIVDDVNDHAPAILYPASANESVTVSNRAPIGHRVSRVQVADLDEGLNGNLTFALLETTDSDPAFTASRKPFAVHPATGNIVVTDDLSKFDYYVSFLLLIHVSDKGTPPQSAVTAIVIIVDPAAPYFPQTGDGEGEGGALLAGSTFTAVAIVAVASLILVACLLVAVVMVRSMSDRKRRSLQQYKSTASVASANGMRSSCSAPEIQRMLASSQALEQVDLLRSAENVYCQKNRNRSSTASSHVINLPPCHRHHAASNNTLPNIHKMSAQFGHDPNTPNAAKRSSTVLSSPAYSGAHYNNTNVPNHILKLEAHLMALLAGQDQQTAPSSLPDDDNQSAGEVSTSADSGRGPSISMGTTGGVTLHPGPGSGSSGGYEPLQQSTVMKDGYCYSPDHELLHQHHLSPRTLHTFIARSPESV